MFGYAQSRRFSPLGKLVATAVRYEHELMIEISRSNNGSADSGQRAREALISVTINALSFPIIDTVLTALSWDSLFVFVGWNITMISTSSFNWCFCNVYVELTHSFLCLTESMSNLRNMRRRRIRRRRKDKQSSSDIDIAVVCFQVFLIKLSWWLNNQATWHTATTLHCWSSD